MKSLKSYSNEALLNRTKTLIARERKITLLLIEVLREIDSRMLYAELGFSSLWEFATKYLSLSEGAAQRRISAMRLVRDVPHVSQAIEAGDLSLSNAAKLQSFFNAEKKAGTHHTQDSKQEIVQSMMGLSQKECEQKLVDISPAFMIRQNESVRPLSQDQSLLKIILDSKTIKKLDELKSRLSHQLPGTTYADMIDALAEEKVQQLNQKMKSKREKATAAVKVLEPKSTSNADATDSSSPLVTAAVKVSVSQAESVDLVTPIATEVVSPTHVTATAKVNPTSQTTSTTLGMLRLRLRPSRVGRVGTCRFSYECREILGTSSWLLCVIAMGFLCLSNG